MQQVTIAAAHRKQTVGDKAPGLILAEIAFPICLAATKVDDHGTNAGHRNLPFIKAMAAHREWKKESKYAIAVNRSK